MFHICVFIGATVAGQINTPEDMVSAPSRALSSVAARPAATFRTRARPADSDAQIYTGNQLAVTFCAAMCLVHFDAVRLRTLRRAGVQITFGAILTLNNVRLLIRERAQGLCARARLRKRSYQRLVQRVFSPGQSVPVGPLLRRVPHDCKPSARAQRSRMRSQRLPLV